jgi:hypothetical protein
VAIDPRQEPPIPFNQVPNLPWIPRRRRGRKLHPSSAYRWFRRGVGGVKLEAIRVGGALCTTEAALVRFFERLAGLEARSQERLTEGRQQKERRVEQELDAEGL